MTVEGVEESLFALNTSYFGSPVGTDFTASQSAVLLITRTFKESIASHALYTLRRVGNPVINAATS